MTRHWLFTILTALAASASVAAPFTLDSVDVHAGATIPDAFLFNGFGCHGDNVSPALAWRNVPAGTKSFALLVHDADAPTGGAGFWHWVLVDLPAHTRSLARGAGSIDGRAVPPGARQIANDFSMQGWGGPCPPAGAAPHHYRFTVYALAVEHLDVPANATAALGGFMVNLHAIGHASLTARYGR